MTDLEEAGRNLTDAGSAIGVFAADEDRFRALVDAFRARDADTFQRLLRQHNLLERCERICHWISSKECVLICLELAGPPPDELPDPREFAEVIVRLTADEEVVERLANAVEQRDADAFGGLVAELKIERFRHLLCQWVCSIRHRLICSIVCAPVRPHVPPLEEELTHAGQVLRELLGNESLFKQAEEAARLHRCEVLRGVLFEGRLLKYCEIICEFFCTWRCLWLCLRLCRPFFGERIELSLTEAFEFARVSARLSEQGLLPRFAAVVDAGDADGFAALVKEHQLERYCIQLCHWACFELCELFCRCVCPNPFDNPLFTRIGDFGIYSDIDPTTGRTNTGIYGHGGPDYGFFACLPLVGFVPKTSPVFSGAAMRYRFRYEQPAGNVVNITGDLVCQQTVGTRLIPWWDGSGYPLQAQVIVVRGSGPSPAVTPPPGPALPGVPWPGPPQHFIVPDGDGWIEVDQSSIDNGFQGTLMGFRTTQAFVGGDAAPGVPAGTAVPAANQRNGVVARIIFEATRVVGSGSTPDFTNKVDRVHISNWDEVRLLDLLQFHSMGGTPCSDLTDDLDIEYTVDHELLHSYHIGIVTAATLPALTLPSGTGPRGAAGTHHEDISAWPSCSYAVQLTTRRSLTTGYVDDSDKTRQLTFCIGPKSM